jgi:hypothetical protein
MRITFIGLLRQTLERREQRRDAGEEKGRERHRESSKTCIFTQRSHWHNGSTHGRHELRSHVCSRACRFRNLLENGLKNRAVIDDNLLAGTISNGDEISDIRGRDSCSIRDGVL